MTTFHGSVRLEADPGTSVRAMVEVGQDEVVLIAGDVELGRWPRTAITLRQVGETFVMRADEERLILEMDEAAAFGAAMTIDEDAAAPGDDAEDVAEPGDAVDDVVDPAEPEHADAGEEITTSGTVEPVSRAPDEMGRLRNVSVATYRDDNVLRTWIGLTLAATGLALGIGAALTWGGHARLLSDGFPLARVLAGIAAAAALTGAYLGIFAEQRRLGGIIAAAGSTGALVVLYLSAREAGLGIGFLLAIVGALGALAVGIAALLEGAAAPSQRSDT